MAIKKKPANQPKRSRRDPVPDFSRKTTTNNQNTNGAASGKTSRRDFINNQVRTLGQFVNQMIDPRRNIEYECGYPETELDAFQLYDLFMKEPIAARVVEVLPTETWQAQPQIYEEEDTEEPTEFEQAWDDLPKSLHGEHNYYQDEEGNPVMEALARVDRVRGIGRYGIVLMGFDDGKELRLPLVPKKGMSLIYLSIFPEHLAQVNTWEDNPANPRYGQPKTYNISFNDPREISVVGSGLNRATMTVHWTRIIHCPDNIVTNKYVGNSSMRSVIRRLIDLQKIYGANGEGYWKNAFTALSLESDPALGGDVDYDEDDLKDMFENYEHGLSKGMILNGFSLKSHGVTVNDPTPHVNAHIEAICIKIGCPIRIFKGSERGELASSQDERAWNQRLKNRQRGNVTPTIIIPFVNRLIWAGVLPEPKGFSVFWPDIDTQTSKEKADVANVVMTALSAYIAGGVESLIPPTDALVRILGWDEEDAAAVLENAAELLEEKKEEDMLLQEEEIERGIVADPTDPEQNPVPAGKGPPAAFGRPPKNGKPPGKRPPPFGGKPKAAGRTVPS